MDLPGKHRPHNHLSSPAVPLSLYISSMYPSGQGQSMLFALNVSDGSLRWQRERGPGAITIPALVNGILYQGSLDRTLSAFKASDGSLLWQAETWGPPVAPAVQDGIVYTACAFDMNTQLCAFAADTGTPLWQASPGYVLAHDLVPIDGSWYFNIGADIGAVSIKDGSVRWLFKIDEQEIGGEPLQDEPDILMPWTADHQHTYVTCSRDYQDIVLYALHTSDGSIAWRFPTTGVMPFDHIGVDQEHVYLLTNEGNGYAYTHLSALDTDTGSVRWRTPLKEPVERPGWFLQGVIYLHTHNHHLAAFNASDGSLLWIAALGGQHGMYVSLRAGDHLYVEARPHQGLLALDAQTGTIFWRYPGEQFFRTSMVHHGVVYGGAAYNGPANPGTNHIFALNERDGSPIWRYDLPSFFVRPIVGP